MNEPRWSMRSFGDEHAPTLVLLHSIATRGEMWLPQIGAWSAHWRCILVDLPGHGATPPDPKLTTLDDYARELLAQIEAPRMAIVGLSFGGMIAQACAIHHAPRIERLVIANSLALAGPPARELWAKRIQAAQDSGMAAQADDTLARWFTPAFRSDSPLTLKWIRSLIEGTPVQGYCAAARAIAQLDYLERLAQIRCPALVITGSEDSVATPAVASAMAARIPGARQALLEGASHLSNVEQPIRFGECVGAFLLDGR